MPSKMTPGPWEAREVSQPWIEILGNPDAEGSRQILGSVRCPYSADFDREQAKANARAIAAVPDMLAALERMAGAVESLPTLRDDEERARYFTESHYGAVALREAFAALRAAGAR